MTGLLVVAAALILIAAALAVPVPIALARTAWPTRAPARALLLWQVIALAGGFSMIGALIAAGFALLPSTEIGGGIVFGAGAALAAYLLSHLAVTVALVARSRRRHRALLGLLTSPHPTRASTLVLEDSAPLAYCVPRGWNSLTVLSRGLLDRLSPDELSAVIAHERAHLEQRHDILLVAFRAWRSALPWFPIAARAAEEVDVLVELLADDSARRVVPDATLARAIVAAAAVEPDGVPRALRHPATARSRDRLLRLAA
ncbi:MAG: M56 family metallopeptidase [Pseudolysinimonas sp.]|uniref:M56 family metallopeptidase n=1 Tax=Pseudolysinimonas sp. TaxID=2680009 RepID=UPI003C74F7E5